MKPFAVNRPTRAYGATGFGFFMSFLGVFVSALDPLSVPKLALAGALLIASFVMFGISAHASPYFFVSDDGVALRRHGEIPWKEISTIQLTAAGRDLSVAFRFWSPREMHPSWWQFMSQPRLMQEIVIDIDRQSIEPAQLLARIKERCPDDITIALG